VHRSTRHSRAPRAASGIFAAAAVACAISFGFGPLAAQEPGHFPPAALITEIETAAQDELRLSPIATQSFLQATTGVAAEKIGVDLPEALPAPAGLPAADSRPETFIMETGPPGVVAVKPPAESTVPGCETDDRDIPLTLAEVLDSVRIHFPLLQAVERERAVAAGRLTSAMGAFDTNLTMSGNALAPGTYENYRSDMGVSQMLTVGGISLFGGYRTGFGDFPTYNLGQKTADAGEWRGGVNVPLARNREIDRQRATRAQAQLDVSLAEPVIERSRLDFMRSAARAYWSWMGTGERRGAADRLLLLATERDLELQLRVDEGATANIERVDNQQNVALRNGLVVQADRLVQQATIDLSLYLRDPVGKPVLAGPRRLRPVPEPVSPGRGLFDEALSRALAARPEFARLSLQREKLIVERRLAVNNILPGIDGQLTGNQDAGYGSSPLTGPLGLDRQVLQASLIFQMPAQRRDARGKLVTTDSQLMQLERQLQYARDQVQAEVQDAFSALERAYEFHKQARQRLELARIVAEAEREQLRLGRSDVLRVTLREQAKFEADVLEVTARQEFWRAESDLRAADTSLGPESPGLLPRVMWRGP